MGADESTLFDDVRSHPLLLPPPPPAEIRAKSNNSRSTTSSDSKAANTKSFPEAPIRDYYLLGMLAPKVRGTERRERPGTDDSEEGEDDEPSSGPALFPPAWG